MQETVKSLNLLFPQHEKETQRLLKRSRKQFNLLLPFKAPRKTLAEFDFWRDRLLELHEEVYLAPPSNLRQIWADHRRPESWYYFWIGVLVLLLTLTQTVASLVSLVT